MAHPDLNQLLNSLLPFAQQMLSKYDEFFPFGATIKANGEIANINAYDGDELPPSQRVVDLLTHALKQGAASGTFAR